MAYFWSWEPAGGFLQHQPSCPAEGKQKNQGLEQGNEGRGSGRDQGERQRLSKVAGFGTHIIDREGSFCRKKLEMGYDNKRGNMDDFRGFRPEQVEERIAEMVRIVGQWACVGPACLC